MALLQIDNLSVDLKIPGGSIRALDNFCLRVEPGSYHGIIGDSGSGKSIAMLAILGLLPSKASVYADHMSLEGHDILKMTAKQRREILYQKVSIIFQEPQTSLNPCYRIAYQIHETLKIHGYTNKKPRLRRLEELLYSVGIEDQANVLNCYPHQLTAGILQRIMITIAMASNPELIIADEPTEMLDPFEQQQILSLLTDVVRKEHKAMILIDHGLSYMRENTDQLHIMYCSQVVESGATELIFEHPLHPYTQAILDSQSSNWDLAPKTAVPTLKGNTPSLQHLPVGCYLGPRCPHAEAKCVQTPEPLSDGQRLVRCHFPGS